MNAERTLIVTALSMVRGISAAHVRAMEDAGLEPEDFFTLPARRLSDELALSGRTSISDTWRDEAMIRARAQLPELNRHSIRPLFLTDPDYPADLREIPDAPVVIYRLGKTDLNRHHIISIVGTRRPTGYGLNFCNRFVEELHAYFPDLTVVSGLAFGIDAAAHEAAMRHNAPTVGVLAHGLQMIYPAAHRDLARMVLDRGGSLISEYPLGEKPYRQRFLERNRIVAGLSKAVVVAESGIKGGAMSTANLAFSYNREVLALPGRSSDPMSAGCNLLIRKDKARLTATAADAVEILGWKVLGAKIDARQRNLFPELDGNPKIVYDALRYSESPMSADSLHIQTSLPMSTVMSVLSELEFDGIVTRMPGNRFTIA